MVSLLPGHIQPAVIVNEVILVFDSPVQDQLPLVGHHLFPHGNNAFRAGTVHRDAEPVVRNRDRSVQIMLFQVPVFKRQRNVLQILRRIGQSERRIGMARHSLVFQVHCAVLDVPSLVKHAQHPAAADQIAVNFKIILEVILRDDAFMIFFIQFFIVYLCVGLINECFCMEILAGWIDQYVSVIGPAHQELDRVDQAGNAPVVGQDGKTDVLFPVFVFRIFLEEGLDHVKIIVKGMDFGIAGPFEHLLLDIERVPVHAGRNLPSVIYVHAGNRIQRVVTVRVFPDQAVHPWFKMCPETGCLFRGNIVQQIEQFPGFDQFRNPVHARNQIRTVFRSGSNPSYLFKHVSFQELKLKLQPELFLNHPVNLVVLRRGFSRLRDIAGQRDRAFFSLTEGNAAEQQGEHCQK